MKKSLVLLFIPLLILTLSVNAQQKGDILNLMNGQTYTGVIKDTSNGKVFMDVFGKKKNKSVSFEHYRVFSYQKENEKETILYRKDTTIGNYFSQEEMKFYFLGERDARKNYNPIGTKITSFLFCYGVALFDTYAKDSTGNFAKGFFKSEPGVATIVAPVVVTALAGIPSIQIRIDKVSNRNYLNEQTYIDGFEKIGRSKKVFGALKFSVLGSVLGLATYFIAK